MGKNKVKVTGFRITDESILEKMGEIAKIHKRTRNQEVEWALDKYVKDYEAEHGSITKPLNKWIHDLRITDNRLLTTAL